MKIEENSKLNLNLQHELEINKIEVKDTFIKTSDTPKDLLKLCFQFYSIEKIKYVNALQQA